MAVLTGLTDDSLSPAIRARPKNIGRQTISTRYSVATSELTSLPALPGFAAHGIVALRDRRRRCSRKLHRQENTF
jgi:hypothetical protein